MVRARPVFKAQYGFSLEIDAIDPEYTLGDLEARKRRLERACKGKACSIATASLPPWDYRLVLVVAPQEAAGLGDFRKEAERLADFGICRFVCAHSRFQGEGAARAIVAAATAALQAMRKRPSSADSSESSTCSSTIEPDAIVIIRGGGAVNDLAWLNDYDLARFICYQTIPVLTGIGHERDSTVPDEVAHTRFDTPSKVIAGIEQHILRRSREARQAWDAILAAGLKTTRTTQLALERTQAQIQADVSVHLAYARQGSTAALNAIAVNAVRQVHDASRQSLALLNQVRADATGDIASARQRVPALMTSVGIDTLACIGQVQVATRLDYNNVMDRSAAATRSARQTLDTRMHRVAEGAQNAIGQGRLVTSSQQANSATNLSIEFRDGFTNVRTYFGHKKKKP